MLNLCAAILIFKMEEKMQYFDILCFINFKKSKNATEMQKKKFVQGMDKVLRLMEHVKSGLQKLFSLM